MNGAGSWQQLAWAVAWFLLSGACAYSYYRLSRVEVSLKKMRQAMESVWGLKLEAREIKRCWPGSLARPGNLWVIGGLRAEAA